MLEYLAVPLLLASWSFAATLGPHRRASEALVNSCQFNLGGRDYDLCPIGNGESVSWPVVVEIGDGGSLLPASDYSDLDGPESRVSAAHCPDGLWICLKTSSSGAILARYPLSRAKVNFDDDGSDAHLTLLLSGAHYEQHARIELICDPRSNQPKPTFLESSDGVYKLSWVTEFGCSPAPPAVASVDSAKLLESNEPEPSSGEDSPSPEDDKLLDPLRPQSNVRRTVAIIIFVIGLILAAIYLLVYHPSRPLNYLGEHVRAIPHLRILRPWAPGNLKPAGESRLVQWAQEDMGIQDDLMVNANELSDDVLDEYIPLSPSPRKGGGRVRNYGTAVQSLW